MKKLIAVYMTVLVLALRSTAFASNTDYVSSATTHAYKHSLVQS